MNKSIRWVNIIPGLLIIIHLAVLVIGFCTGNIWRLAAACNFGAGISVIIYWAARQLQIKQQTTELREFVILGFKAVVACSAAYSLYSTGFTDTQKIIHCLFFGVHSLVLIAFSIFAQTFRIKKMI